MELSRGWTQDFSILCPYLCYISFLTITLKDSSKIFSFLFLCHPRGELNLHLLGDIAWFSFIYFSSSRTKECCQCTDIMELSIKQLLKMMQKCAKSAGADTLNLRAFEIL